MVPPEEVERSPQVVRLVWQGSPVRQVRLMGAFGPMRPCGPGRTVTAPASMQSACLTAPSTHLRWEMPGSTRHRQAKTGGGEPRRNAPRAGPPPKLLIHGNFSHGWPW